MHMYIYNLHDFKMCHDKLQFQEITVIKVSRNKSIKVITNNCLLQF